MWLVGEWGVIREVDIGFGVKNQSIGTLRGKFGAAAFNWISFL